MLKNESLRLTRKLLLLAVLLGGLLFVVTSPTTQKVAAAPCCSSCEAQEAYCYEQYEQDPSFPLDDCLDDVFRRCWRWCNFGC